MKNKCQFCHRIITVNEVRIRPPNKLYKYNFAHRKCLQTYRQKNIMKKQETPDEREERKSMYLTTVLRHSQGVENIEEVLQEASEKFDKVNPIK